MKPCNRFIRPILLLAGLLLVGGCSILPKAEPSDVYR